MSLAKTVCLEDSKVNYRFSDFLLSSLDFEFGQGVSQFV